MRDSRLRERSSTSLRGCSVANWRIYGRSQTRNSTNSTNLGLHLPRRWGMARAHETPRELTDYLLRAPKSSIVGAQIATGYPLLLPSFDPLATLIGQASSPVRIASCVKPWAIWLGTIKPKPSL